MKRIRSLLSGAKLMGLAVGLAVFGILGFAGLARAAEEQPNLALAMMPTVQDVTLKPGQSQTYTVTVLNDGKSALDVKMLALPYGMNADYSENVFDAPSTHTQITDWVEFKDEDKEFRLEGGARRVIDFEIKVPKSVPSGGQYGAIAARGTTPSDGGGVMMNYQIASLLLTTIDGTTERKGEVINRRLGGWYMSGDIETKLTVKNTGNTHFFTVNRLIVEKVFGGKEVARVEEGTPKVVFNDDGREFEMGWKTDSLIGFYWLTQESEFLGVTHSERRLAVVLPLWIVIVAVMVLVAIVGLIVWKIKSRRSLKRRRRI